MKACEDLIGGQKQRADGRIGKGKFVKYIYATHYSLNLLSCATDCVKLFGLM
jgi:hypothetical protein